MALMTLNGTTVQVAPNGVTTTKVQIGDKARSFLGTLKWLRRAEKRQWAVSTAPIPSTSSDVLVNLLASPNAISLSGDIVDNSTTLSVFATLDGVRLVSAGNSAYAEVEFTLEEI